MKISRFLISPILLFGYFAHAAGGVPLFLPFQGRVTDSGGSPINYTATFKFRIYPPGGTCYIYEDTQTVTPNQFGFFSIVLGASANSTGPANQLTAVFSNDAAVPNSCASTYTPSAADWRRMEILVDGNPMPDMQTIAASGFSINSQLFDGKAASSFIQVTGNTSQANVNALVSGTDIGNTLHNHDSIYAQLSGSNTFSGNVGVTGNIFATGTSSKIGIGTTAPTSDFEIRKDAPSILLGANAASGGSIRIDFASGATQRARIQGSETTNELRFFTGTTEAMRLDASQNLVLASSMNAGGTIRPGQYNNAQEAVLVAALPGIGASAQGATWYNTSTQELKYWNGTVVVNLGPNSFVSSVGAGTGLTNSGTAGSPVLDVDYGSTAGTAIQGNAAFGGDVSGIYTGLTVARLQGRAVANTAPSDGQLLRWNNTTSQWVPSSPLVTSVATRTGDVVLNYADLQNASGVYLTYRPDNTACGSGQILSWDGAKWICANDANAGGDITAVSAGTGLTGGGTTGAVTLAVDVGTTTGQIVQVAASNRLPAIDGRNLTQINAVKLQTFDVAATSPTSGQVLKWNNSVTQWEPSADTDTGITALTGEVTASGSGSVAATIAAGAVTNGKIADGAISTAKIAANPGQGYIVMTDATTGTSLSFKSCGIGQVLKWTAAGWDCDNDAGASGSVTHVGAGTGLTGGPVTSTGTLSVDVGTTNGKIVQVGASDRLPAIDGRNLTQINAVKLQSYDVAATAPTSGYVLKWNGSHWEPAADNNAGGDITDVNVGAGLLGGGIVGSVTLSVDVGTTNGKIVQVGASDRLPAIDGRNLTQINAVKLQTYDVAATAPTTGHVLKWNGSHWEPSADNNDGDITAVGAGTGLTGGGVTGNVTLNVDVGTTNGKIVQIGASDRLPAIDGSNLTQINAVKLQTYDVAATAPTTGYVLKWNGSYWEPAIDQNTGGVTSVASGTGLLGGPITTTGTLAIDVGTTTGKIVQVAASDKLPAIDGSDLTQINAVRLQGFAVNGATPTANQVLKWNNAASYWQPSADTDTGITALTGEVTASGSGSVAATIANGAISTAKIGTNPGQGYLVMTDATTGANLEFKSCGVGQVLKWTATGWDCDNDAGASGSVTHVAVGTGLTGGPITSTGTISIDVGTTNGKIVQVGASDQLPAIDARNLTNVNAVQLQARNVAATAPTDLQVLTWNNSTSIWEPRTPGAGADHLGNHTATTNVQLNGNWLSGDGQNEGVFVTGAGSVGVGTSNPQRLFHVNGPMRLAEGALPGSPAVGDIAIDSGDANKLKWHNGAGWQTVGTGTGNGTVTSVVSGTGLVAGTISSTGTINIDVGTTNGKIVQVGASDRLPAIDGRNLTNINAVQLQARDVAATAPTNGQILTWNNTSSVWEPRSAASTASNVLNGGNSFGGLMSIGTNDANSLVFRAGNGERMRLLTNGNLGIGTTTPDRRLHISGTSSEAAIRLDRLDDTNGPFNIFARFNAAGSAVQQSWAFGLAGGTNFQISDLATAVTGVGTPRVTVTPGGNVGIGNAVPQRLLHVGGTVRLDPTALPGTPATGDLAIDSGDANKLKWHNGSGWQTVGTGAGGVTSVVSGTGLVAGTISSTGTIDIDVGTTNGKIVQVGASDRLPAIDGRNLTNINAVQLQARSVAATAPTDGQVLTWNNGTSVWEPKAAAGGAVSNQASLANGRIWIGDGTGIAQENPITGDATLSNAGAVAVTRIRGTTVSATAPTAAGQALRYSGTEWVPAFVSMQDLRSNVTGSTALAATCGANQTLTYNSAMDNLTCSNISIAASQVTSGTGIFVLNGGQTGAVTAGPSDANEFNLQTSGTARVTILSGGNVGIATTAPTSSLAFGGTAARSIGMERHTTANSAGNGLTLSAGGATSAATDMAGGDLILSSGISTGVGTSKIQFRVFPGTAGVATDDNVAINAMTILGSGNVGIGTTAPTYPLDVNGTIKAIAVLSTSDARLKTNVRPIQGLELVKKLNGVRFDWIRDGVADFGLIAQEVERVLPEAVMTDANGIKAVKYQNLIAPLIEAVKEQELRCEANAHRLNEALDDNARLRERVKKLESQNQELDRRLRGIETALGIK